ncbi:MAG: DNA methyltransferase, partial [Longimicrobiales bacterium]
KQKKPPAKHRATKKPTAGKKQAVMKSEMKNPSARTQAPGEQATDKPVAQQVKLAAAKGRPMLSWVGKRPLTQLTAFPAQHIETLTAGKPSSDGDLWKDWPAGYPPGGLLFHGDNKEVLAHLLAHGFRGKVKLIYIDPPFDSGADYVRKVSLRNISGSAKLEGESYSLGEQIQYTDIWANDNYLQFMYERLLLLKELLSVDGSILLHCDWHRNHLLRSLLDEVFGADNLLNEIIWQRTDPHNDALTRLGWIHDTLYWYRKADRATYNWAAVVEPLSEAALKEYSLVRLPDGSTVPFTGDVPKDGRRFKLDDCTWKGITSDRRFEWRGARPSDKRVWPYELAGMEAALARGEFYLRDPSNGAARCRVSYLDEREGQVLQTIWTECGRMKGGTDFPTQKPEELLSRIATAFSGPGDLVLDCFIGSGTTAAVAQKLGRRWIGCDINKGAIQLTSKRLQSIMLGQAAQQQEGQQSDLLEGASPQTPPAQLSFTMWRVNDYDLQIQHNEAVELACRHIGVERTRSDSFFDGVLGKKLVKIVPFGHPLTPLDLEDVSRELEARPDEDRDIVMICLGKELAADRWLDDWNRLRRGRGSANRVEAIELRTDPKYGKFFAHQPAEARLKIQRRDDRIEVKITDFISPTILERLELDLPLFRAKITDWRSQVDCVLIDTAYNGEVFNVVLADIPERKDDLVSGRYDLPAPAGHTTVAVKVIDMLGEEVVVRGEV